MCRSASDVSENEDWGEIFQVVVSTVFSSHVLSLDHDHLWSGHMGDTKTCNRVLKHFFWPGLQSDVVQYCRTCHVCQVVGKPNQVTPPLAPLSLGIKHVHYQSTVWTHLLIYLFFLYFHDYLHCRFSLKASKL